MKYMTTKKIKNIIDKKKYLIFMFNLLLQKQQVSKNNINLWQSF